MSDNLRLYTNAIEGFDRIVRSIPEDGWGNPSPCAGWRALDVVGHMMGCSAGSSHSHALGETEAIAAAMRQSPFFDASSR